MDSSKGGPVSRVFGRAVLTGVVAVMMALPTTSAGAQAAIDAPEASFTGAAVDAWQLVGNTINGLVGTSECSISASTPVNSSNVVSGAGSVGCNRAWAKLTLTVCIQGRPAFVNADEGWQELGCAPPRTALSSSGLSSSHTVQCQPTAWRYRTHVTAEGFRADSADPGFTAMITSSTLLADCFL